MIAKELQKRILSSIILIPIAIFFILQEAWFFLFFLSICFLVTSYEWIKMNKIVSFKVIGVSYLFFAFIFTYLLRETFSLGLFVLILIICIFTDLGGYIFGKFLKGPKLIKISPQKTYSGAFGGFILSLVAALVYSKYTEIGFATHLNFSIWNEEAVSKIYYLFVMIISFTSQVGDLIISYFKRLAKIKDTGNLLPGHGGLLDRIDGMIFAFPFSYIIFKTNIFSIF
tara:strand:+ start:1610 stop:2290 length:681 start_codon:yes stop_codon:yes gene_type:complete